jgi:hypothetical protein
MPDARPSGFTQLTTTTDWEMFMSAAGIYDGADGTASFTPGLDTTNRTANLGAGSCLIKGQLWNATATVKTAIPAASAQDRLDRLVVRLNRTASTSATVISPVVITGAPSGSPVLPPLQQTPTGLWDIPVSHWTSHASGTIDTLVDERQYCGRSVVSMTSAYHPSPANPRIGLETDTGNVLVWNGSAWPSLSTILFGYGDGPLGDIGPAWTDQASIQVTFPTTTIATISSSMIGQQVTSGPATVHVNRIQIDGAQFEIGRDRNIINGDLSSICGVWTGTLNAGLHTIKNTAYSSSASWRLTKASIQVEGYTT